MAIIQISKIQQRSGNLVDLPQLDEAQFGWASDAKRLFIGKTSPNENIEVLTSYSNISFSQIDGSDNGNFNISGATNGQVLTYVTTTDTWENWPSANILTANANFKLNLGDVGNINMAGGATGYILETDGVGNLSWTSKGTLRTTIRGLSNATPIIMTVANTTPYTNGLAVTISGANAANANTIVNGKVFYVKVSNNFPTSGNVELYTTSDLANANAAVGTSLGTYTANSGIATAVISGTGVSNAGGSVNTIQFNNLGVLDGSANFTISGSNVTLNGNLSVGNISGANLVSANFFTGTLTTSAQPNITSTGTLAGLVVAGNITPSANITYNLGNNTNRFNDLYLANSTIYIGAQTISANASSVIVSGNLVANITGNVSGNVTTAGTVTTAAQPNITSLGTLTSVSVSGNANIGNIGTGGLITATGNIRGGNLTTGGAISATGNANVGNIGATSGVFTNVSGNGSALTAITGANVSGEVSFAATANAVAGGNVSGQVGNALVAGTVYTGAQPNITSTGTLASLSVTANANIGNIGTAGLITATGNLNAGNIITAGVVSATGNGTFGNVSATTHTGTTVSVTGNSTAGNLITGGVLTATGNITGGNLVTGGVVSASGNASVLGIKTDNYYYANGVSISFAGSYSNSNVASFLASYGSNTISTTGNISGGNVITSKYLINSIQTGISAAGSTQGTGTALANTVNIVSTVASGAGVVLPTAVAGMTVYITNTSANSLLVYPATGAVINELSTNAGYSQATKATIHYVAASSTQWYSVGATYA